MKTLDSALKVLNLFLTEEHTLSVGEIATTIELPKSKVSRLLAVFRDNGFLEQDPVTRRYRVGLAAFELGSHYVKSHPLAHEALPIMRSIVDQCGHSTTLSVMRDHAVLHIMAVEGPLFMEGRWRVGNRLPYHASSAGKILVAALDAKELNALLASQELRTITPLTVTDKKVFRRQLAEVRETGYCISRGESAPGLAAIAVPVLGFENKAVAAIGLVIPDHLFDAGKARSWIAMLHQGARALSMKLGAAAYPHGTAPGRGAQARVLA